MNATIRSVLVAFVSILLALALCAHPATALKSVDTTTRIRLLHDENDHHRHDADVRSVPEEEVGFGVAEDPVGAVDGEETTMNATTNSTDSTASNGTDTADETSTKDSSSSTSSSGGRLSGCTFVMIAVLSLVVLMFASFCFWTILCQRQAEYRRRHRESKLKSPKEAVKHMRNNLLIVPSDPTKTGGMVEESSPTGGCFPKTTHDDDQTDVETASAVSSNETVQ